MLEPAAAAPEPSAAAQVRPGAILLEELLVLRDHVAVDRLPNQALRDEERVQLLLVERAQVDGVLLVAVALYRQRGRPPADPGDGHALVARRAERRPKEALHLRQAIELSAGARDDVGRHLLRVRSGAEDQEGSEVCMHFCCLGNHKRSAPLEAVEVVTTGVTFATAATIYAGLRLKIAKADKTRTVQTRGLG